MRFLRDARLFSLLVVSLLAPITPVVAAPVIWDGPSLVFQKQPLADPTLAENQDRITDTVWITRANTQGLYNAATEPFYTMFSSPAGTEWAFGTTADLGALTFASWQNAVSSNPPGSVGLDMVLHLVDADAYLDIRFDEWGMGSTAGGSFSYTRSTPPVPEPAALALFGAGVGAVLLRRVR